MTYYFIINPNSGKADSTERAARDIITYFEQNGGKYQIFRCDTAAKAYATVDKLCRENRQVRVCACGGDGTLNAVVSAASRHGNAEVGCYASGESNDFIKCFGTLKDFRSVDNFVNCPGRQVDMLRVNDYCCINMVTIGTDSLGATLFREKPAAVRLSFELDGERLEAADYAFVAVANGRALASGRFAAPEARMDDGLADILLVPDEGKLRLASLMADVRDGVHLHRGQPRAEDDRMLFRRARAVTVESDKPFEIAVDGERFSVDRLRVEVRQAAWRFICPQQNYQNNI